MAGDKTAGQLSYEAYREGSGNPALPEWHALAPEIRSAWEGRARAALRDEPVRAEWNQGTEYR